MVLSRVLLILLCLQTARVWAQAENPLNGKIVHIYNPYAGIVPQYQVNYTPKGTMIDEGGNWYRITISGQGQYEPYFNFRDVPGNTEYGPNGLATPAGQFDISHFGGGNEIWIMADPHNPTATKPEVLTSPPRLVHVLNPWKVSVPEIVVNGTRKSMLFHKSHCEWYTAYILTQGPVLVHFVNKDDGETFGKGGIKDNTPFDLAAEFASKGTNVWILDAVSISGAYPGGDANRSCNYLMAAVVHDMASTHPDYGPGGNGATLGMVDATLGPDRKPVPTAAAPANFRTWFNSDSTRAMPLKGYETCVDVEMSKSNDGLWEYDSFNTPNKGYFPINDFNKLDQNVNGSCYKNATGSGYTSVPGAFNFGFCMESHATFVYKKGQVFEFRGDDDVWVYINGKLALDLGGVHEALDGKIELDKLGLVEGQTYPWDFFFCERKTCSSSLRIKTTIYFNQARLLEHTEVKAPDGTITYTITRLVGGTGACGNSTTTVTRTPATGLAYVLHRASGEKVKDLGVGVSNGGITIQTPPQPHLTIDTSKIVDLAPGDYRVVYFDPVNSRLTNSVTFTVPSRNVVELDPPYLVDTTVGSLVRVVAANRYNGTLMAEVGTYKLTIPAGLQVYEDQAKTRPVTAGTILSTGADGLATLWVTGNPDALTDMSYPLVATGSAKIVTLMFRLPPLDLPVVNTATIHDEDANGIADRIVAVYDRDISARLPGSVAFQWPASAAQVPTPGASLAGLVAGTTLTLPMRPLDSTVLTAGSGWLHSSYPARGGRDSLQTVTLVERIAPVLRSAVMLPGDAGDTLRLVFSEPVNTAGLAAPADLFVYRLNETGADLGFTPTDLRWNAARDGADLIFPSGSTEVPRSGNWVRIKDGTGGIGDAAGNMPGPNSRFRIITGTKKASIATVTRIDVDPAKLAVNPAVLAVSLEGTNTKVEDIVDRTGRLGHLIKVDLGDHTQAEDFTQVDPAKVFLEYHVGYFTNHGHPIASEKRTISCLDPVIFNGDCRTRRGYLFVGWNFTTLKAQRVGTGAYIARIRYKVVAGSKSPISDDLDQVWGVLRTH